MHLFFDSIIFLYLIAASTLAIGIFRDRKRVGTWEHQHPTIARTVSMFLCFSVLVVFWGSFVEPRLISINRVSIDLPNFAPTQPVRVALISDVHVGTYKKSDWIRKVSARIAAEKLDLVFIAGDLIVDQPKHVQYLSSFQLLTSSFSTYAVLGDHDYGVQLKPTFSIDEALAQTVEDSLVNAGVQVLHNETRTVKMYGASFTIVGLDDWLARKTIFPPPSGGAPPLGGGPTVILIHNPDFILAPESKNADLILAGNTHGGQIRLPFDGPVPLLPSRLPRSFDEGLFTVHDHTRLFITSGIGESGPRARLFNPPEIVLLELR